MPPQSTGGDSPSSRSQAPPQQQQQPPMHPGQGSYQQPPHLQPQPHGGGYKMGPNGGAPGMQSPYPQAAQSPQQYQQGSYQPRSPYPGYGQPAGNMGPGGGHYPNAGRPMQQPPHGQYPPYHQQQPQPPPPQQQPPPAQGNWTAPPQSPVSGKPSQQPQQPVLGQSPGPPPPPQQNNIAGGPPPPPGQQQQQQQPPPSPGQGGPNSQRQLNYLKQHLQHKVGSPTPPQPGGYGNGPGMHPPMGPPHQMGPPPPNGPTNMGPPTTPQSGGPPFSGHGSHPEGMSGEGSGPHDNGLSSSGSNSGSGSGAHANHPVTSVVTTGPDGSLIDEASQQSTLSNASAGEWRRSGRESVFR